MIKWTVIFVIVIFVRLWIFFFNKKKMSQNFNNCSKLVIETSCRGEIIEKAVALTKAEKSSERQEQQQTWFIHKIKQEVNVTHNTHCYHYVCEVI